MTTNAQHTHTPIPNWPGYYVTAEGRVFSGSRELRHQPNDDGYPSVRLSHEGKRKRMAVHRLVAVCFLPPRPSLAHEIRHLDGNRGNPCSDNLAWGTRADNAADRERHGMTSRGARHSAAIKASNQAEGTRAFRRSQREAANV